MKNKILILYAAAFLTVCSATTPTATAAGVLGIDVSANQGTINWSSVHGNGIQFAYAKATEGTSSQDTFFHANMNNGKAAGIYMGAYEFSRPDLDTPSAEANYFWNFAGGSIGAGGFNIMPAVALEVFNGHVGAASYTAWINAWCADVKAKTPHFLHPVISIGACDACNLNPAPGAYPWIINTSPTIGGGSGPWTGCTSCEVWGPNAWDLWLFTDTLHISGVTGNCDGDQFNGSLADLVNLLQIH